MPYSSFPQRGFTGRYLALSGGETFGKICVMVAFAYLARALTPSDYGIVEQAFAITFFFVLATESGTGLYGARIVAAEPQRVPQLVSQVMWLRAMLGIPAFAAILALSMHYRMLGLGILAVNGIAVLLTPFLTQWVFQGIQQMSWVATGAALRNFTFMAVVLALVRPGSDIRLVAVAELCGIAVLSLVNAYFLHVRLGVRPDADGLLAGTRRLFGDVWYMGLSDLTWACLWYSPATIVGWAGSGAEQVAWVAAGIRIVLAVHTFVFLYFFNLLPNLAVAVAASLDGWRELMRRSIATSIWPACLVALAGTLLGPVLIPIVYGQAFAPAVLPFQIAIWMIPIAWFGGHFRFSLVAAGQQWWEFLVSTATAVVTVITALVLSHYHGAPGAASAFVLGGVTSATLAVAATFRHVGRAPVLSSTGPALLATALCLVAGFGVTAVAGEWAGTFVACLAFTIIGVRQNNELVRIVGDWIKTQR